MAVDPKPPRFRLAEAEVEPDAVPSPADEAKVSPLPPELLQPNEIIILLLKPSGWYIVLASLKELAIVAVFWLLMYYLANNNMLFVTTRHVNLIAGGLAGVILFWRFMDWLARVYVLTDRRIVRVKGVFRVSIFEAKLTQVQHTETYFSIRERVFGLGTLGFATAGSGFIEAYWMMVPKPLEIHRIVVQTIDRYT